MKRTKVQKNKEKSLLTKLIEAHWERIQTQRALRLCSKQEWSVDFLTALLVRASNDMNRPLEMTLTSPNGAKITVRTTDAHTTYRDDSIFNHLDNEVKIQEFISAVNR